MLSDAEEGSNPMLTRLTPVATLLAAWIEPFGGSCHLTFHNQ